MAKHSSTPRRRTKRTDLLPYPDFPLSPHVATRRWFKTIRGHRFYFGRLDDPDAALQKYERQRDDLYAGRTPRETADGLLLRDLLNAFLTAKQRKVDAGELKTATFYEYYTIGQRLIAAFGKTRLVDDLTADDFGQLRAQLAKTLGPAKLGKQVQLTRSVFKYGYEAGLIDKPIRYGPEFVKPSAKLMRQARQARGERMLDPSDILKLLELASVPMQAMVLLGINCGMGNTDVAELPLSAVDQDAGFVDFPRPKTAIARRCPLWAETVEALRRAIAERPKPKDKADAGLVFVTRWGHRWVRTRSNGVGVNSVTLEFSKLLKRAEVECVGKFYILRHVFRTIADEVHDPVAIDRIMGHEDASMAARYRERISDDRLLAVTDCVHQWLYGAKPKRRRKVK